MATNTTVKRRKALKIDYTIDETQAQKLIKNAFSEGCLMWIDAGAWGNSKRLRDELMDEAHLPKKAVRANQDLINRDEVRAVTSWINKLHNWARSNSMPWMNKSVHFIHKNKIDEAEAFAKECKAGMLESLEVLVAKYDELKAEFKAEYPKFYSEDYYPTKEQLYRKFRLRWGFQIISLPSEGSVRVLSKEMMAREDRKYKERMKEVVEESVHLVRNGFYDMIKHLQESLEQGKKFKDVSVEKPKAYLQEFFTTLNVYGDEPFAEVAQRAQRLLEGVYGEDLRDDEEYRKVMSDAMKEVAESIDDLPEMTFERDLELDF